MVKSIYLLMGIILLTGCDTRLHELTMRKTPYYGNELRIDGYYYSNMDEYNNSISVAVFYRDGFCINTHVDSPVNQDTLGYIENEILLNNTYIAKMKREPFHIGVFQIMYPDIQFEIWEFRSWPFTYSGNIVNDTTFIINKRMDNRAGKSYSENLTYRFKQFSQKPDSTNNFVK